MTSPWVTPGPEGGLAMLAIDRQRSPNWDAARAALADLPTADRKCAEDGLRRLSEMLEADFHRLVDKLKIDDVKVFVVGGLMDEGPPAEVVDALSRTTALEAAGFVSWQVVR